MVTWFVTDSPGSIALPPCDCDRCQGHCVLRHDVGEKIAGAQPFNLLPCPDCHERHAPLHMVTGDVVLLAEWRPCYWHDEDNPPNQSDAALEPDPDDCDCERIVAGYLAATVLEIIDGLRSVLDPPTGSWLCILPNGNMARQDCDGLHVTTTPIDTIPGAEPGGVAVTFEKVPVVPWHASPGSVPWVMVKSDGHWLVRSIDEHIRVPAIGDPLPADAVQLPGEPEADDDD